MGLLCHVEDMCSSLICMIFMSRNVIGLLLSASIVDMRREYKL